jgi:DNA-binding MarR family transcriptional regulator
MPADPPLVESTVPHLGQPRSIFDLLNFRLSELYGVSGSLVTRMCEGEFGITREEWAFLAMMAALGPLSPSQLAMQTTADRSQISKTLRSLADKQLIHREAVPGDRRRAVVRLSARGEALYGTVFPRVVEIHHAVLGGLEPAERELLACCIQKMQVRALEVEKAGLVAAHAHRQAGGSRNAWRPEPAAAQRL